MKYALALVGLLATMNGATAQDYYGNWGTRDPVACGRYSVDRIGPGDLNAVLATSIFQCGYEADPVSVQNYLNLIEDVRVKVGKQRPFGTQSNDYSLDDADADYPVYPIQVSGTNVNCHIISDIMENRGSNCAETPQRGDGTCYVTSFGEWACHAYLADTKPTRYRLAPR